MSASSEPEQVPRSIRSPQGHPLCLSSWNGGSLPHDCFCLHLYQNSQAVLLGQDYVSAVLSIICGVHLTQFTEVSRYFQADSHPCPSSGKTLLPNLLIPVNKSFSMDQSSSKGNSACPVMPREPPVSPKALLFCFGGQSATLIISIVYQWHECSCEVCFVTPQKNGSPILLLDKW